MLKVAYAGSIGIVQNLQVLLETARREFVMIGDAPSMTKTPVKTAAM
ncbi:glycosyltransferase family 4 protein [Lentibacillus persicus]|nr:glycosyltransferase family 4 protein [Lentibacillus persicus]